MEPIRLFIGSSFNGEDFEAERTYEYSLRNHCDAELNITWMRQSQDSSSPFYGWNTQGWGTPFTAFRWAIPHLCGFQGKAIFTDVDMLNLRDISILFNEDMQDKPLKARRHNKFNRYEFSVMLMDCEKLKPHLPSIDVIKSTKGIHDILTKRFSHIDYVSPLDMRWNCLDGEDLDAEDIWQLHFTNRNSQPWCPAWFKGERQEHKRPDLVELWKKYCENSVL